MTTEFDPLKPQDRSSPITPVDAVTARLDELERQYFTPTIKSEVEQAQNPQLEQPSAWTEFTRGVGAGWRQVGTDLRSVGALGLQIMGAESDADSLMRTVMDRQLEDERRFPKSVAKIEDIESVGDFTRWAARSLGEQVPVIASMIAGGLGANVLGRLVGRGAISLGAAPQLVARFPSIGTGVGVMGTNILLESGSTGSDLYQATQQIHPEVSFTAGIVKGALESIVPAALGARIGIAPDFAAGLMRRVNQQFTRLVPGRVGNALAIGTTEAATEALQEAVDIAARGYVDENYDVLGFEAASRILNAAAGGLLVGSVIGSAYRGNRAQTRLEEREMVMPALNTSVNLDVSTGADIPSQQMLRVEQSPDLVDITLGDRVGETLVDTFKPLATLNLLQQTVRADLRHESLRIGQESPDEYRNAHIVYLEDNPAIFDREGKRYRVNEQAPGTAVFLTNTTRTTLQDVERQSEIDLITDFYSKEMKALGFKDERLVVFLDSLQDVGHAPTVLTVKDTHGGHYSPYRGFSLIGIKSEPDAGKLFEFAVHEFGHFISIKALSKAPPEIQQKIIRDYQEALRRASFGDMRNFGFFASPGRWLNWRLDSWSDQSLEQFNPIERLWARRGKSLQESAKDTDYYFSLDEYMAEQIAKYYSKRARDQWKSETGDFFSKVAQSLEQMFERAKKAFGLETTPSIVNWLESLRNQTSEQQLQKADEVQNALNISQTQGRIENEKVLASFSGNEFIPPPQASTSRLRRLVSKLGIPAGQAREITSLADKFNWFTDLFFNLAQIAQLNPHIKPLAHYVELVDAWYNFQMNWMGRANDRLREWTSLGKTQSNALSKFLFDVDSMSYLTAAEKKAGVVRLPTDSELRGMATKNGLNAAGFNTFLKIREDFTAVLDQIEQTSIRDIQRTISDAAIQAQEIARVRDEFNGMRQKPYFPHSRFGDYAVIVKDSSGKTLYMEQFRTLSEAKTAAPDILRDFRGASARVDLIPKEVHGFRGLPPALLSKIRDRLQLSDVQSRWLEDLTIEMSPSASFRHRLSKRMDTPGFSLDAKRGYASYFFSASKHLARIEYKPLLEQEVQRMGQEITGMAQAGVALDAHKRRQIQNYMANHLEHIMNPKPDWHALRAIAFQWYLGFNPSSAALNLTQPVLVGWPYLAARFGDGKAATAMMKAVKDIQNVYKFREPDRVSDALLKSLDRAIKEGVVEESQATELASTAQGAYLGRLLPGTELQRRAQQLAHMSAWMFQQTERLNRRIMFRAGWQLAMDNRNSKYLDQLVAQNPIAVDEMLSNGFNIVEARAYLAGKDAVRRTQFQYAAHARPKFMRGKKGVFFTFFMFTQSMLHFALFSPGNVRYLAMMVFMAGLMGLPGGEDLMAVARFLARNILGKDFDVEKEVRELVTGMLGDAIPPDIFLHGLGRIGFGMPALMDLLGLPKAQFDFSRRIGFGRIIPGLAELGPPGLDFDQALSNVSTQAAGAVFGIGLNILRAMQDDSLPIDDFKRWERALPNSVGNVSRALRAAREGRERSRTGATVVDYDITDPDHIAEISARALGFQPTRLQREWDRIKMQREAEAYWGTRRSMILRILNHSFTVEDPDLREEALKDVRRYNQEVPFGSMRITSEQIQRSRKEHMRQVRLREVGLSKTKANRPLLREIEGLHPETARVGEIQDAEDMTNIR